MIWRLLMIVAGLALLIATRPPAPEPEAALPPSVRPFYPVPGDTTAWPGYIRHHAGTARLAAEVEDLKAENQLLADANEHLIVAVRGLSADVDVLVLQNRLIREYLNAQREKTEPVWSDSVAARRM